MKKFKLFSFALTLSIALLASFAFTPNTVVEDDPFITAWTIILPDTCDESDEVECTINSASAINCKNFEGNVVFKKNGTGECTVSLYKPVQP
ncbi:MAG: hypothetical protein V3U92_03360 [Cellulophaga sp.]